MYRTFKRPGNLAYGKLLAKVEITDSFPLWSRRERGPPTFQDASALNFETPKGSDTSNRISTLCKSVNSSKKKRGKKKETSANNIDPKFLVYRWEKFYCVRLWRKIHSSIQNFSKIYKEKNWNFITSIGNFLLRIY